MKLSRLETHDRLLSFQKEQAININQGLEDCLKKNSLSLALQQYSDYIYIFAHPRTAEDGVTKKMIWQPRLSKPRAQTNSYLFRAVSHSDLAEICWLLPPREMWAQYEKGNITESEWVKWSIHQFTHNREDLEKPFAEDHTEERAKNIYLLAAQDLDKEFERDKLMDHLWI
jgi:hypothetical protein